MDSPNQPDMQLLPHLSNVRGLRDRISSAAVAEWLQKPDGAGALVDEYFGHSWSYMPQLGAAVYGKTDRFPSSPLDHLAKGRFLRVPFRRVPVLEAKSFAELEAFVSKIHSGEPSVKVMWRGQNRNFSLQRDEATQLRLYGEVGVEEPSLLSSGARRKIEFPETFRQWSAILDVFMNEECDRLSRQNPRFAEELRYQAANHHSSYSYRLWSFATAQHYGLPSVGLDVTSDLYTALLFALYRFEVDANTGVTKTSRIDAREEPILYVMGAFENDLFDDALLSPPWLQGQRPKAQSAHFLATGWGMSPNRAAERIFVAIRLMKHELWDLPRAVESLLPSASEDHLLHFLLDAKSRFTDRENQAMLSKIYF